MDQKPFDHFHQESLKVIRQIRKAGKAAVDVTSAVPAAAVRGYQKAADVLKKAVKKYCSRLTKV